MMNLMTIAAVADARIPFALLNGRTPAGTAS